MIISRLRIQAEVRAAFLCRTVSLRPLNLSLENEFYGNCTVYSAHKHGLLPAQCAPVPAFDCACPLLLG